MLGRVRVSLTSDFKSACFHQHSLLNATACTHPLSRPGVKQQGGKAFLSLTLFHLCLFLYQILNSTIWQFHTFPGFRLVSVSHSRCQSCFYFFKAMKSDLGEFMFFWAPLPLIIFSFFSLLSYLTPVINTCFTSSYLTSLNASPFLETVLSLCLMYNFLHHDI